MNFAEEEPLHDINCEHIRLVSLCSHAFHPGWPISLHHLFLCWPAVKAILQKNNMLNQTKFGYFLMMQAATLI